MLGVITYIVDFLEEGISAISNCLPTNLPWGVFILSTRDILLFYIILIKPLRNAQPYHLILATSNRLTENVDKFIEDEICYQIFLAYLEHRANRKDDRQISKELGMATPAQCRDLLYYLSEVLILERKGRKANKNVEIRRIIKEYIEEGDIFPDKLKESITKKVDDKTNFHDSDAILFFADTNFYAYNNLDKIYQEYKSTRSFRNLEQHLKLNEKHYNRLDQFGMI